MKQTTRRCAKYRGWRERVKWRREGRSPLQGYRRDNQLWRLRFLALVACVPGTVRKL